MPEETTITKPDYATAFYGDYEIYIKYVGSASAKFVKEHQLIEQRYARKNKMVEDGLISKEAGKELTRQKMQEIARLYADLIIVGWKNLIGDKLPEFTKENVIEFLTKKEHDLIFTDIIIFSATQANYNSELEEAEIKN